MTELKVLLKSIFILLILTNMKSSALVKDMNNCLTCTEYPINNTSPSSSPPSSAPITTPAIPVCPNCSHLDCSAVTEGTTFPFANHCKLYYKCVNRVAVICTCANGYWYERDGKQCELCPMVTNCPANLD